MTFDPASLSLVHTIPGADAVAVTPELPYADGLTFDLYRPAGPGPHPVVVLVQGYGSDGPRMSARPMRAWASYVGWARLLAASGVAAVNYGPRTPDDGRALVEHLRADAAALDLDPARLGLWACSGHGPAALWLAAHTRPACAAFLYAYLLDLPGATEVAAAAAMFRFAAPPVALAELPAALPLLIVRAGADATPGLDASLQRFVAAAGARGQALTVRDVPDAPHAFDLMDPSPASRAAIDDVLAFFVRQLRG